MKPSIVVALIVLFHLVSCRLEGPSEGNGVLPIDTRVPTPVLSVKQLTSDEKLVIYWSLLDRIYGGGSDEPFRGSLRYKTLTFRTETIAPVGIENLRANDGIPKSLLEDFERSNLVKNKVFDVYPGVLPIYGYAGERDMQAFFKYVNERNRDVIAVVGLSNIGLDAGGTRALLYGEFYKKEGQLERFFVVMEMDRHNEEIDGDRFSGVERFEFIKVQ